VGGNLRTEGEKGLTDPGCCSPSRCVWPAAVMAENDLTRGADNSCWRIG
jgi:hypothetical protein